MVTTKTISASMRSILRRIRSAALPLARRRAGTARAASRCKQSRADIGSAVVSRTGTKNHWNVCRMTMSMMPTSEERGM